MVVSKEGWPQRNIEAAPLNQKGGEEEEEEQHGAEDKVNYQEWLEEKKIVVDGSQRKPKEARASQPRQNEEGDGKMTLGETERPGGWTSETRATNMKNKSGGQKDRHNLGEGLKRKENGETGKVG